MKALWNFIGRKLYDLSIQHKRKAAKAQCKELVSSVLFKYLEVGNPEGEVVLLLHGFSDHKDSHVDVARGLMDKYHIYIPDLPGFGESERVEEATHDVAQFSKWIAEFIEVMQLDKFHIMGHSLGGAISATLASEYPEKLRSLALLNAGGVMPEEPIGFYKQMEEGRNLFEIHNSEDFKHFVYMNFYKPPFMPRSVRLFLYERYLQNRDWYAKVMKDLHGDLSNEEQRKERSLNERLKSISVPTAVIWGKEDRLFPPEIGKVFHDLIPGSQFHVIPEGGHCINLERPRKLSQVYREFIENLS